MPTLTPVENDPFATPTGTGAPKLTPVDHDPFATGSGAQSAQPGWTDYLLQHLAGGDINSWNPNAPNKPLGQTALWNKPSDVSWGDYMAAHVQPVDDFARSAINVFGLGDRFAAGMYNLTGIGGGDLAAQRAQTAAAAARNPSMAAAGSVVGGLPVSELGLGAKLGETVLPYVSKLPLVGQGKWLSGVLGAGTEGVGTAEAGSYGRTDQAASPLEVAVGALSGVPGGVVRGEKLAPAVSADALRDAATQTYKPLSNILYDATKEVHPQIDITDAQNALRDWSGYKWGDASKTSKEIQTLLDKPQLSANDIQQSQSYLKGVARNPNSDPNDKAYAGYYIDKLQHVLENGTPQAGVPAGAGPGYAAQVKADGDVLHGRANDVERLNDWIAKSQVAGGPDVGGQASSYLRTQQGQRFAPPGSPGYDAINTLAKTNAGPDLSAAPGAWDIRHGVHPLVSALGAGAITGAGGQIASGHYDPASLAAEAAIGAMTGYGLHKGVPWAQKTFVQGPAQQRAIDAARTVLSTGQQQSPVLPPAQLRDTIRRLIYGQGAAGNY